MAIQLEFINLVVPVRTIVELYPGGWPSFIADHAKRLGRTVWFSSSLVRAGGAMESEMADALIARWTDLGFTATEAVNGRTQWKDFVLVDAFGRSLYPCSWIMVDGAERLAWLRGGDPGGVVGRENFQ
jgi:hypothetical protein